MKMKKKIIIWNVFILISCFFGVKNVFADILESSFYQITDANYHYVDNEGNYGDFSFFRRRGDKKLTYSLNPNLNYSDVTFTGYYNYSYKELANIVNLTEEQLRRISLISYFGFGYSNHSSIAWIDATQSLIWQEALYDYQYTSKNYSANPWLYVIDTPALMKLYTEEIEKLINDYESKDTYNFNDVDIFYGDTYVYESDILDGFLVDSSTNCEAYIEGDKLYITPSSLDSGSVSLIKKVGNSSDEFYVYLNDDKEILVAGSKIPDIEKSFSFNVLAGNISLNVLDSDSKTCENNRILYKLYNESDEFIANLALNSECSASISNLSIGKYYIVQENSASGYKIDTNKYEIELSSESNDFDLVVYNEKEKRELSVKSFYQKNNITYLESNSKFTIYDENNNEVTSFMTSDSGSASILLPFGNYILHQETCLNNYILSDDITFTINDDQTTFINVINEPYKVNLKLNLVDESSDNILEKGLQFKIYDLDNSKYICQDKYTCIFETDENGEIYLKNIDLSNYRIIKLEQNIDDYTWENNYIDININEETLLYQAYFVINKVNNNLIEEVNLVEVANKEDEIIVDLPNTYKNKSLFTISIGLLLFIFGLLGYACTKD
jgi:hypothetical protein